MSALSALELIGFAWILGALLIVAGAAWGSAHERRRARRRRVRLAIDGVPMIDAPARRGLSWRLSGASGYVRVTIDGAELGAVVPIVPASMIEVSVT
jgi:hypothetical protein